MLKEGNIFCVNIIINTYGLWLFSIEKNIASLNEVSSYYQFFQEVSSNACELSLARQKQSVKDNKHALKKNDFVQINFFHLWILFRSTFPLFFDLQLKRHWQQFPRGTHQRSQVPFSDVNALHWVLAEIMQHIPLI